MTIGQVRQFQVTIPHGTLSTTPLLTDLSFPPMTVESITVRVPPGPSGLVGFQLWVKGGQAIPAVDGTWIITDDELIQLDMTGLPDSGAWQLNAYNEGNYDHTINVRFGLSDVPALTASPPPAATVPDALLSAAAIPATASA